MFRPSLRFSSISSKNVLIHKQFYDPLIVLKKPFVLLTLNLYKTHSRGTIVLKNAIILNQAHNYQPRRAVIIFRPACRTQFSHSPGQLFSFSRELPSSSVRRIGSLRSTSVSPSPVLTVPRRIIFAPSRKSLFRGTTGCGVRSNHIRPGIRSVASGSLNASSISYSVRPATVYEKEPGGSKE